METRRLIRYVTFYIGALWLMTMLLYAFRSNGSEIRGYASRNGDTVTLVWSNVGKAFYLEGSVNLEHWQPLSYHLKWLDSVGWNRFEYGVEATGPYGFYRIRELE